MRFRRGTRWVLLGLGVAALAVVASVPSVVATRVPAPRAPAVPVSQTLAPTAGPATPPSPGLAGAVPGTRPPQFVVLSFDGGGAVDLWQHWREVAARDRAHFTFFLSAAYLLTAASKDDYLPPRHRPGASDIGNLPIPAGVAPNQYLADLLAQISAGYTEGNEIGTHFGGHFCLPGANSVASWTAADWSTELDQVSALLANVNQNNALTPPVTLPFGPAQVVGDRTPCLQGKLTELYPVLAQRGFRYDASQTDAEGQWPKRQEGIWSFPLASIPLAGRSIHVLSMDYNLYVNQSRAHDVPAALEPTIEEQAYQSFLGYFNRADAGNRAPVIIGAHFTHWNDDAYLNALTRLMDDVCLRPEVRCVSFRELADWLDAQSPDQLAALNAGSPTAALADPAPPQGPAEQ